MRLRTLVVPVLAFGVVLAAAVPAGAHPHHAPSWKLRPTGSTQQFRGLAAVSHDVAWLAGTSGTVLRTSDGGRHWADVSPAGASALQFRDVEAWDARHAVALTIGNGTDSRVYRTSDGGRHWTALTSMAGQAGSLAEGILRACADIWTAYQRVARALP